uniref:Protein phosphatase 2C n=1 Tax=Megaviridae environmental sample TaxID=1737588 RepID=A0A5J6VL99_9VIRU|nr:MAG: protein phosphatase 2C [Megaviridae environmental sample]
MKVYSFSLKGKRESNEDEHINIINLESKSKIYNSINFIGIYDGHGGKLVSKFIKNNLPKYFLKKSNKKIYYENSVNTKKIIKKIFTNVQNRLKIEHPSAAKRCGTTALNGIIYKNNNNKLKILIANIGDSRAVLLNKNNQTKQLSKDHKPNASFEKRRIEKLGGMIEFDGFDWRIENLSLSRAFGDIDTTPYVTHEPDVFRYNLNKRDKFIIFACDGLWDTVSNINATNFINNLHLKEYKGNYAKKLAEYAYKKGSTDNITVSIIFLS